MTLRAPDVEGPMSRAWRIDLTAHRKTKPGNATVENWLINGPFHPLWNWWVLYCVHLRAEPGLPEPTLHKPDSSHEFCMWSWNPEHGEPNLAEVEAGELLGDRKNLPNKSPFLSPPDFVVQVQGLTDEQAAHICEMVVTIITRGRASPDSDWRRWWETSIENAARHVRGDPHTWEEVP
jgi:hypothetical protein